ncbi:MAG: hypothetical protein K6G22_01585 [Lachnospiraceae bacterium]|nr:hypothetical protein [Lachnospiraceae bacterium]
MEAVAREKLERLLKGELKYTSSSLAFNMLISKLKKRIQADQQSFESCMNEMDEFLTKYPIVAKVDLANIALL